MKVGDKIVLLSQEQHAKLGDIYTVDAVASDNSVFIRTETHLIHLQQGQYRPLSYYRPQWKVGDRAKVLYDPGVHRSRDNTWNDPCSKKTDMVGKTYIVTDVTPLYVELNGIRFSPESIEKAAWKPKAGDLVKVKYDPGLLQFNGSFSYDGRVSSKKAMVGKMIRIHNVTSGEYWADAESFPLAALEEPGPAEVWAFENKVGVGTAVRTPVGKLCLVRTINRDDITLDTGCTFTVKHLEVATLKPWNEKKWLDFMKDNEILETKDGFYQVEFVLKNGRVRIGGYLYTFEEAMRFTYGGKPCGSY